MPIINQLETEVKFSKSKKYFILKTIIAILYGVCYIIYKRNLFLINLCE